MINNKILFLLLTVGATNAHAAKPEPKPATDVVCDGCVGTIDIERGAVTNDKLSAELQDQISHLPKTYYVVDAANQKIGRLLIVIGTAISYEIINQNGYATVVRPTGELNNVGSDIFYTSPDCTGQGYVRSSYPNGIIINNSNQAMLYVPLDANEIIGLSVNSRKSNSINSSCSTYTTTTNAVPANINDPAVTGVPNEGYLGRLSVQLL